MHRKETGRGTEHEHKITRVNNVPDDYRATFAQLDKTLTDNITLKESW